MRIVMTAMAVFAATMVCAVAQPNGEEIYMEKCTKCHGDDGQGNPKALLKLVKGLELDQLKLGPIADKSDEEVRQLIVDGKDKMPGYADKLSAEEIEAVLAYSRKLVEAQK